MQLQVQQASPCGKWTQPEQNPTKTTCDFFERGIICVKGELIKQHLTGPSLHILNGHILSWLAEIQATKLYGKVQSQVMILALVYDVTQPAPPYCTFILYYIYIIKCIDNDQD